MRQAVCIINFQDASAWLYVADLALLSCCCLSGRPISYAKLVRDVLTVLKILAEKVTYLTRIFAAQLLITMGLRLDEVQCAGGWLKDCLGTAYIVMSLSPETLLALAMCRKDGDDYQ